MITLTGNDPRGWQQDIRSTLGRIELLGELGVGEEDRDRLAAALRARLPGREGEREAESIAATLPEVLAAYLVATGVYRYREGNFWDAVRRDLPSLTDRAIDAWRRSFRRTLEHHGLPTFRNMEGLRHVAPILAHGGVPRSCLARFFDVLLWPAVTDPYWAGAEASELIAEWTGTAWLDRDVPKPVHRFLRFGGRVAETFVARCLRLAREEVAAEAAGLPGHVVEAFRTYLAEGTHARRVQAAGRRFVRPRLVFDAPSGIVMLELPRQTLFREDGARELAWVIELDGRQERLIVQGDTESGMLLSRETRYAIAAPPASCRVVLRSGQERLREWSWSFRRQPFDCYVFTAADGLLVDREVLPPEALWLLTRADAALTAVAADDGEQAIPLKAYVPLGGAWAGREAKLVDASTYTTLCVRAGSLGRTLLIDEAAEQMTALPQPEAAPTPNEPVRWALFGLEDRPSRIDLGRSVIEVSLPVLEAAHHPAMLVAFAGVGGGTVQAELVLEDGGRARQTLAVSSLKGASGLLVRGRFDLGALTDTLRQARSGSLTLTLRTQDKAGGRHEEQVARISQAWSPTNVAAEWLPGGRLQVRWSERLALSERYAWLWDLWRPWRTPIETPIPDEARGAFDWQLPADLEPGHYRLQLGLNSIWNPVQPAFPAAGAPGSAEAALGTAADREGYLAALDDGPRSRAVKYLARATNYAAAVDQTYYLEAQVGPADLEPLLLTLSAAQDLSAAAHHSWTERLRQIACDYSAPDVLRWLLEYRRRVTDVEAQAAVTALLDLGWLARVGPGWKPAPRPVALGEKRVFPVEPLDTATRAALWDFAPLLALGCEAWPLDDAAIARLETAFGDATTGYRPWREGAEVVWGGRVLTIEKIEESPQDEEAPSPAELWRTAPPVGWRLTLAGGGVVDVTATSDLKLQPAVPDGARMAPLRDVGRFLAMPEAAWTAMRDELAKAQVLDGPTATIAGQGGDDVNMAWLRDLSADVLLAAAAESWCRQWGGHLQAVLGDLPRRAPALALAAEAVGRYHHPVVHAHDRGQMLALLPFVTGAVALAARACAWKLVPASALQMRPAELDELVRDARRFAPLRFERDLLLTDLLIGPYLGTPAPVRR